MFGAGPVIVRIHTRLAGAGVSVASAVGIALAAVDLELPAVVRDPLDRPAALAIPAVLLVFGISLTSRAERPARPQTSDLLLALVAKTVLMPLIAYALARWCFHLDGHQIMLATVLAALPAAQNISTYAAVYHRGKGLARDASLLSTVLSVPIITAIVAVTG